MIPRPPVLTPADPFRSVSYTSYLLPLDALCSFGQERLGPSCPLEGEGDQGEAPAHYLEGDDLAEYLDNFLLRIPGEPLR